MCVCVCVSVHVCVVLVCKICDYQFLGSYLSYTSHIILTTFLLHDSCFHYMYDGSLFKIYFYVFQHVCVCDLGRMDQKRKNSYGQ